MLVQFSVKNHKAIADWQTLSMVPASSNLKRGKPSEDRYLLKTGCYVVPHVLPVALIYGANASGKSSLISALADLQHFVRGTHLFSRLRHVPPYPHKFDKNLMDAPTEFELVAAVNGNLFTYNLARNLNEVVYERLSMRSGKKKSQDREIYLRENLGEGKFDVTASDVLLRRYYRNLLTECGINEAFVAQLSFGHVKFSDEPILDFAYWLKRYIDLEDMSGSPNKFGGHRLSRMPETSISRLRDSDREQRRLQFMQRFEPSIRLIYRRPPTALEAFQIYRIPLETDDQERADLWEERRVRDLVVFRRGNAHTTEEIPLQFESFGTRQLYDLADVVLRHRDGDREYSGILAIDELGSSLHPHLIDWLIDAYSTNDSGCRGQLIFTTHATHAMDHPLIDNDQIWYVEKDENLAAKVYSQNEFSRATAGRRISTERGYFQGRFGALPRLKPLVDPSKGDHTQTDPA